MGARRQKLRRPPVTVTTARQRAPWFPQMSEPERKINMKNDALFTRDTLIDCGSLEDVNKLLMLQDEIALGG